MAKTVVVGLSGGVDSSVATYLLKEQGYDVIGLFMRNWRERDGGRCTAEEDYRDAKSVARLLGVPLYTVDFSQEYLDRVFEHFVKEYKRGRTPNPDVLCNREIKFGPFREYAMDLGADYVATGHYAGIKHEGDRHYLLRSTDDNKDQTYFLHQCSEEQLSNVLFPLDDISKPEVREIATRLGLTTATKKDSTGICFIGERNFREFLANYIPMQDGDIVCDGEVVGRHHGVYYYTIGQRKGLGVGGEGGRWFVTAKDVEKNILYVSHGDESVLMRDSIVLEDMHWINGVPQVNRVTARIRHRQPLQEATYEIDGDSVIVRFDEPQRAPASGQYCVLYDGMVCLGGGVIK